ncbi:MAG: replisome organizer [Lachnospiraceae bacterium]
MAERRMFSKTIIDSDAFIDMPSTARLLYYDLSMRADDDGFINNPKKIIRMTGASVDDMNVLILRKFIIPFESGIVVIKHWKIHNYIQKDRYKETNYKEEKAMISLDENKAYTLSLGALDTDCIQHVSNTDTQVRIGKDRVRIDKDNIFNSPPKATKPARHKYGEYKNVLLSDEDIEKLKAEFPSDWQERIERLSEYIASSGKSYKNYLATIRNWAKRDKEKTAAEKKQKNGGWCMTEDDTDLTKIFD